MSGANLQDGSMKSVVMEEVRYANQTTTLSGNVTLTTDSPPLQFLDPGGSGRTITLPAEADSNGLKFFIVNEADAVEDLTVQDDSPATVGIIGQNEIGILLCDGVTWRSMITGTGAGLAAADITLADAGGNYAATEVEAAFTELASTADAEGASIIGIEDDGSHTAKVDVEEALQEIYQSLLSVQSVLELNLFDFVDGGAAAGTPLALTIFASAADPTAGIWVDSAETVTIRWNNHANPDEVLVSFLKPMDMDTAKDVVVHILAVRSATDASDLVTFDIGAFDNVVGAAIAADADFGGTTGAMADDVNIQELTLTLANANISSTVGSITLTVKPTDGLLATIDVSIVAIWLEYSRLLLTS